MNPQLTRAAETQVKTLILDLIEGFNLRLFINDVFPGPDALFDDFTEPADSGYAAVAINPWTDDGFDAEARLLLTFPLVTFTFNHNAGNFTIFGYWYYQSGNDFVWSYTRLERPVAITTEGQTFSVRPTLRIGGLGAG